MNCPKNIYRLFLSLPEAEQKPFLEALVVFTVSSLLPLALRATALKYPEHKQNLEAAAKLCESVTTVQEVRSAATAAHAAAHAYDANATAAYAAANANVAAANATA